MQVGTDFVGLAGSKSMTLRAPGLEQAGAFGSVTWVIRSMVSLLCRTNKRVKHSPGA